MTDPSRLVRDLDTRDAVFIGLGSMIGAGIFTVLAPAAAVAGAGLLPGLLIAAAVAFFNAGSSAQLARLYPTSGGTYVYANKRLGGFWGWLAGWGFIAGKLAGCSAVALTFGYYLFPAYAKPLAVLAIFAFATLNYLGIRKTANATKVIVAAVLLTLAVIVVSMLAGNPDAANLLPLIGPKGVYGILQSAGLWFFAFAGYSRIATLGEEVKVPERTIPRAILVALAITLLIYAAVVVSALLEIGPRALAKSNAPLAIAAEQGGFGGLEWLIKIGSTFATLGVLLSLMAGISRTLFAMAADGNMPAYLAKVHPTYKVPHLAEVTVGLVLAVIVSLADVRAAIGFSAFTVLLYYAITNMAAYTLAGEDRLFPRPFSVLGVLGCLGLALTLPLESVAVGAAVMAAGVLVYVLKSRMRNAL